MIVGTSIPACPSVPLRSPTSPAGRGRYNSRTTSGPLLGVPEPKPPQVYFWRSSGRAVLDIVPETHSPREPRSEQCLGGQPPRESGPVRPFRPRGRPPACHRRGRSPLPSPPRDRADGATLGRPRQEPRRARRPAPRDAKAAIRNSNQVQRSGSAIGGSEQHPACEHASTKSDTAPIALRPPSSAMALRCPSRSPRPPRFNPAMVRWSRWNPCPSVKSASYLRWRDAAPAIQTRRPSFRVSFGRRCLSAAAPGRSPPGETGGT